MNQQVIRTVAKMQQINEETAETNDESRSAPNEILSFDPAPSELNALLDRLGGLSLAEMDKSIQELQKARNFLRNERERMRLEMAEYMRLTKAAMGSSKSVSATIASFGTVAEEVGKNRTA
jgi:DNA repair ATPase RecN